MKKSNQPDDEEFDVADFLNSHEEEFEQENHEEFEQYEKDPFGTRRSLGYMGY